MLSESPLSPGKKLATAFLLAFFIGLGLVEIFRISRLQGFAANLAFVGAAALFGLSAYCTYRAKGFYLPAVWTVIYGFLNLGLAFVTPIAVLDILASALALFCLFLTSDRFNPIRAPSEKAKRSKDESDLAA